ncbi:MAG TPA: hypoxanthine-guanine phosphoribosyltransferase [Gammaproteobacteria bacterium]
MSGAEHWAALEEAQRVRAGARLVASAEEVQGAIATMAGRLAGRFRDCHPVVLAVMHGGVFAAVELVRHFDFPYEFDYVHVTRYGRAVTGGALEWQVRPRATLRGRAVLLVDDVLDRGDTLAALQRELARVGAAEVCTAVLVVKRVAAPVARPPVDVVGLETDDVYLFGCGMDYKGYWRGLPELYAVDGR